MTHPNLIFYRAAKAKYFRNKSAFGSFFSLCTFVYCNQALDIYHQTPSSEINSDL